MAKILQWATSRSWTRKANIEDIYHLRKDLALLERSIACRAKEAALRARADFERLTQSEEAIHSLYADLNCFRQHLVDLSSHFQTQLATLEQWVKSGAIEARLQPLCDQQSQVVEQICQEHREKMSEIARLAETASLEIRSFSKACNETMQTINQTAVQTQSSVEQSLQEMARLCSETTENAAGARSALEASQQVASRDRDLRERLEATIHGAQTQLEQTRTELFQLATDLFALKEHVTAAADQSEVCASAADKNVKLTAKLLDESAQQLGCCKQTLEKAQEVRASQEEMLRSMQDDLTKAKSYRIEVKSLALKTHVSLGKIQQKNRTFRGRLRWLLRGSPESS